MSPPDDTLTPPGRALAAEPEGEDAPEQAGSSLASRIEKALAAEKAQLARGEKSETAGEARPLWAATAGGGEGKPPGGDRPEEPEEGDRGPDSDALRDLLRRAADEPLPPPKKDVLRGVQQRLRVRSKGKFYADGWSTRDDNPRGTYLITAAVMLVLLGMVYWALVPGGVGVIP